MSMGRIRLQSRRYLCQAAASSISVRCLAESVCQFMLSLAAVRLTAQSHAAQNLASLWLRVRRSILPSLVPAINHARVHVILEWYWQWHPSPRMLCNSGAERRLVCILTYPRYPRLPMMYQLILETLLSGGVDRSTASLFEIHGSHSLMQHSQHTKRA